MNVVDAGDIKDADILVRMMAKQYSDEQLEAIEYVAPFVINYYSDIMSLSKNKREPDEKEKIALSDLYATLSGMDNNLTGDVYQTEILK